MTAVITLLEQIRRQPIPKHDRLENLIDFSLSVEEICATVRTSGVKTSYDGPILQELVDCLPPIVMLLWGMHCRTLPDVTLQEFEKWIVGIKESVLYVKPLEYEPQM